MNVHDRVPGQVEQIVEERGHPDRVLLDVLNKISGSRTLARLYLLLQHRRKAIDGPDGCPQVMRDGVDECFKFRIQSFLPEVCSLKLRNPPGALGNERCLMPALPSQRVEAAGKKCHKCHIDGHGTVQPVPCQIVSRLDKTQGERKICQALKRALKAALGDLPESTETPVAWKAPGLKDFGGRDGVRPAELFTRPVWDGWKSGNQKEVVAKQPHAGTWWKRHILPKGMSPCLRQAARDKENRCVFIVANHITHGRDPQICDGPFE